MKQQKYRCISTLILVASTMPSLYAQKRISYCYDAAGNRTRKQIILNYQSNAPSQKTRVAATNTYNERLNSHDVVISTKENNGQIQVAIVDLSVKETCKVTVYSSQGSVVVSKEMCAGHANVDISGSPAGIYILDVSINGVSNIWKITKK